MKGQDTVFKNIRANDLKMELIGPNSQLMPIIPALWEADGSQVREFKSSLANMVKPCLY